MEKILNAINSLKNDIDAIDSKLALNKYATVALTVTLLGALIVFMQYFPLK